MTEQQTSNAEQVDRLVKDLGEMIASHQKQLEYLLANRDKFINAPVAPTLCGDTIDFDRANREQVVQLIKTFDGDWEKDTQFGRLDYHLAVEGGPRLRLWGAELLPSCQLIETTETIPENEIQRTRTTRKIVCNGGKEAAAQ